MKQKLLFRSSLKIIFFVLLCLSVTACAPVYQVTERVGAPPTEPAKFEGERAFDDVVTQVEFGPRTLGSEGHAQVVDWIKAELKDANWDVSVQITNQTEYQIQNIIAKRGQGSPWIIIGAHYDTRFFADQDPDPANHTLPVPGANDGASGVAVLLELARVLPDELSGEVWLVFFDAEDNGRIPGFDWIMGSRAFVAALESHPDAVVIADMIGDADLQIYWEQNSDETLSHEIWGIADTLGYAEQFIPSYKYRIIDDHVPFLEAGIPAVDLIDFDYPYWHTVADTQDKVSASSLQAVGEVLLHWTLTKVSIETAP